MAISGTREWAAQNVNIQQGCNHDCRYCYARAMALRFGRISSHAEWIQEKINWDRVRQKQHFKTGTTMFPTTHDINPYNLDACLELLNNLLQTGNHVLITTKPHLDCISLICKRFALRQAQILFRFTIGADDDHVLKYWEPGAPSFDERLMSLELAHESGYKTSVSCEPMLDTQNIERLVSKLESFVTHSIWIGKMNRIPNNVNSNVDKQELIKIKNGQANLEIKEIYERLKSNPLIRWKDSVKKVVGLELPEVAGLDR